MLVRPESFSRPPAGQPGAQPTELPVRGTNGNDDAIDPLAAKSFPPVRQQYHYSIPHPFQSGKRVSSKSVIGVVSSMS